MTWQHNVNIASLLADDVGICFWEFWKHAYAQGAIDIRGSGDGQSAFENVEDATGGGGGGVNGFDVITSASVWDDTVANSWSNTEAWVRFRFLGTSGQTHEIIIHRSNQTSTTGENQFKIYYSKNGFDDTAVANANTPPTSSAADEVYLLGSTSTFSAFAQNTVDVRIHVASEDTAQDGLFPWFMFVTNASTSAVLGWFSLDVVQDKVGTETAPWVLMMNNTTGPNQTDMALTPPATPIKSQYGWFDYGGGGEAFQKVHGYGHGLSASGDQMFPGGCPPQVDGFSRATPVVYGDHDAGFFKGVSRNFSWKGVTSRDYPDTIDLASATARIYVGDLIVPWEQNASPQ